MSSINHSFSHPSGDPESEWRKMIAEAAYYIAQNRHFAPGSEIDDWLAAEAQVEFEIARRRLSNLE